MKFQNLFSLLFYATAALFISFASPMQAEDSSPADTFMGETFNIMGSLTDSNAHDVISQCRAKDATLSSLQGVTEPMRLYFGSMIERCIYIAMNSGGFKDDGGDQCTHHMARAKKLAGAIEGWLKSPEKNTPSVSQLGSELENHSHNGELIGCKGDYTVFDATIKAAKAAK